MHVSFNFLSAAFSVEDEDHYSAHTESYSPDQLYSNAIHEGKASVIYCDVLNESVCFTDILWWSGYQFRCLVALVNMNAEHEIKY